MNKFQSILGFFLIFVLLCTSIQLAYKYYETPNYDNKEMPIKLEEPEFFLHDKPNKELLIDACLYYGIKNHGVVVAQAILETGHFRSINCLKNNNLFGLYNSRRKQYYKFNHWTESIQAYKDMIQYKMKDNEDYYVFLKRIGYAEDELYIKKVKNIKNRYEL